MALIIGGIILTGVITIFLLAIETEGDFESEEERRRWYGYLKKGIIMAAQVVTPDNIATVGNTGEDIINYIVESAKEITDSNKNSESTDLNDKKSESVDSNEDSESAKKN